jgi:hypothetical protein
VTSAADLATDVACKAVKVTAAPGTAEACKYTAAAASWPPASIATPKKTCATALPGHDCSFYCKKKGTHTNSKQAGVASATGEYLNGNTCTACPAFKSVSLNKGPIPSQLQIAQCERGILYPRKCIFGWYLDATAKKCLECKANMYCEKDGLIAGT